ncbi:MAG: hypothetical protein M0P69_19155 [Bacteroidales bacterium]|nr:hypothetical protein [Bacteroidales bacterium]
MQDASKKLQCARQMPELKHRVGEGDFDITKSEVCNWLMQQPEILDYLFDRVRGNGRREALIKYDPETKTWKGIDYED